MASPRDISARHLGRRRGGIIPQPNARLPDTPPVDVHARGRSPGLRVAASVRLPKAFAPQWLCRTNARRLQLRGQLRIVAAVMAAPDSRLSLRSSRIEGTSNTIYSSPCKIHVNGWGGFRAMKCKLSPAAVDNGDAGRYPRQAMRGAHARSSLGLSGRHCVRPIGKMTPRGKARPPSSFMALRSLPEETNTLFDLRRSRCRENSPNAATNAI